MYLGSFVRSPSNIPKSIFSSFPDLSANLTILQNETFDLTGIKVCDYDLDSSVIEKTNDQESYSRTNTEIHGVELSNEPMALQPQEDAEAQPTEVVPVLSESHQSEVNLGSHDSDAHGHTNIISHVKELGSAQNDEMNNAGGNIEISEAEKCSVGPGHESSSLTELFENEICMPNDFDASLPLMDKTDDLIGSIDTNVLSIPTSQTLNTVPIVEDEFVEDHDRSGLGAIENAEHTMEIKTQVQSDGLEANDLCASLPTGSKETDENTVNQASLNGDLPKEENGNSMLEGFNEDQIVSSGLGCDEKDSKSGSLFSENAKIECLHSVALVDEKESSLNDEENPVCQEAALQSTMCPAEVSAIESPFVDQNDVSSQIFLKKLDVSFKIFHLLDLSLVFLLDTFNISDIPDKNLRVMFENTVQCELKFIGKNLFLFEDFILFG